MDYDRQQLLQAFKEKYGDRHGVRGYFAPGRVNLIGEHIDYNGGHVLPCTIKQGTYLLASKRTDNKFNVFSMNYPDSGIVTNSLEELDYDSKYGWCNYVRGIFFTFIKHGYEIPYGFDIYISGNIPGSGLSSSASLEVVTACMIRDIYSFDISDLELALLCKEAENQYVGMNCGIMDQYICTFGKRGSALCLDTATLTSEYVPLHLKDTTFIITDSHVPHNLITSHYNERREECEKLLSILTRRFNISHLCELSDLDLVRCKPLIEDEILFNRLKHVVLEEKRVKEMIKTLKEGNLQIIGQLLRQSGDSLKYDYEATCKEIDLLVDFSNKFPGVYGSRETGGGWGGNTITLIDKDQVERFKSEVSQYYFDKTGLEATFTLLETDDGGRRIF